MQNKPDGRKYSRVTRRSVSLLEEIPRAMRIDFAQVVQTVLRKEKPEFWLDRFGRMMSDARIAAYLRFLVEVGVISARDDAHWCDFVAPNRDEDWAQELSDACMLYLANLLGVPVPSLAQTIADSVSSFFAKEQIPTVNSVAADFGFDSGRKNELFRWAFYVYVDGPTCPLDIGRSPYIEA